MSDYIPLELLSNILARLPVDDVLRCTSVCKSWYDLITSSSFISLHLKISTPNQETRLLVYSLVDESNGVEVHCKVHSDNQTFDEIAELEYPFDVDFDIIGSINGLLCLLYYWSSKRVLLLWNPSLRKSLTLREPALDWSNVACRVGIGFGFLPEMNDYKIVRLLLCYRFPDFIQVDIYKLSANSWHNVSVRQGSYLSLCNDYPGIFLEGTLHWIVRICHDDNSGKFGRSIFSFDVKNENVGGLSVPNCMDNDKSYLDISAVRESLCLIHCNGACYDIWVMNEYGVPDSWTMQFKIDNGYYIRSAPLYFRENGEVILHSMLANDTLVSYDPKTRQVTNIGKYEVYYGFRVTKYMESLVLISQELKSSMMKAKPI